MNAALLLALAFALDAVMGEPRWLWSRVPHPAVVMGRVVAALDHTLNKGEMQRVKGVIAVLILATLAGILGWLLQQLGAVAGAEIPGRPRGSRGHRPSGVRTGRTPSCRHDRQPRCVCLRHVRHITLRH